MTKQKKITIGSLALLGLLYAAATVSATPPWWLFKELMAYADWTKTASRTTVPPIVDAGKSGPLPEFAYILMADSAPMRHEPDLRDYLAAYASHSTQQHYNALVDEDGGFNQSGAQLGASSGMSGGIGDHLALNDWSNGRPGPSGANPAPGGGSGNLPSDNPKKKTPFEKDPPGDDQKIVSSDKNLPRDDEKITSSDKNPPSDRDKITSSDKNSPSDRDKIASSDKNPLRDGDKILSSDKNPLRDDEKIPSSDKNPLRDGDKIVSSEKNLPRDDDKIVSSNPTKPIYGIPPDIVAFASPPSSEGSPPIIELLDDANLGCDNIALPNNCGIADNSGVNPAPDATTIRAVPEPATLALLGLVLTGLGISRRRRA